MYTAEDNCDLLSEEEEIEIGRPANLYSIIKTIELVEQEVMNTYIDSNTQRIYVNELLDQFDRAKLLYGSKWKDLNTFCKENGLEECTLAKLRITKGKICETKSVTLVARLVQDLNDMYNTLETFDGDVLISSIKETFQSIVRNLRKGEGVLDMGSPEIRKVLGWRATIDTKQAHETISDREKQQLKLDLSSLANFLRQD